MSTRNATACFQGQGTRRGLYVMFSASDPTAIKGPTVLFSGPQPATGYVNLLIFQAKDSSAGPACPDLDSEPFRSLPLGGKGGPMGSGADSAGDDMVVGRTNESEERTILVAKPILEYDADFVLYVGIEGGWSSTKSHQGIDAIQATGAIPEPPAAGDGDSRPSRSSDRLYLTDSPHSGHPSAQVRSRLVPKAARHVGGMAFPPQICPPPMDEAPLRHIPTKSSSSNPFGALAAPSGPRRHEVCIAPGSPGARGRLLRS